MSQCFGHLRAADVHPFFYEMLLALGWPVHVRLHRGWTGSPHTCMYSNLADCCTQRTLLVQTVIA